MTPAYEKLKFYQDICQLRIWIYKITERFYKTHLRLVSQMRDAARSAKQNIREGYKKETVGEFSHSIKISRGSLEELSGDVEDCFQDNLITKAEFEGLRKMIGSADFLSARYLQSLYKMEREKKWKMPRRNLL
ncbi:MAG: four helix bundle protein [bacterium]|nr:four helix bundle protein [bacterium]